MKKIYLFTFILILVFSTLVSGESFNVDTPIIKLSVKENVALTNPITIINNENRQTFHINYSSTGFISTDTELLTLGEYEKKNFAVNINNQGYSPGVYAGQIQITGEKDSLTIPVILEMETKDVFVDVSSQITPKFLKIFPKESLVVDIGIYNSGGRDSEIILEYSIINLNTESILSETESLSIKDQIKLTKSFLIPKNTALGDYVFFAVAKQKDSVGVSSLLFEISPLEEKVNQRIMNYYLYIVAGIIITLLISVVLFNHYWDKKIMRNTKYWREKIIDIKKIKFSDTNKAIKKLEYQKSLLERAYKEKYIKSTSYKEGKKKINELIKRLKKRL